MISAVFFTEDIFVMKQKYGAKEKSQKCFVLFLLFNSTWFNISNMRYYKTHINALPGTNWKEVMKKRLVYIVISYEKRNVVLMLDQHILISKKSF